MTKLTLAYFGAALVVGLLLTPARKYLASKWLWLGGLIAFALCAAVHRLGICNGWPTLEFWKAYASGKTYPVTPIEFLLAANQHRASAVAATLVGRAGLLSLFQRGKTCRPLGIAYVVLFLAFMLTQAKNYFLAPAYPMLFAAGARVWSGLPPGPVELAETFLRFVRINRGILTAPMALPVLPIDVCPVCRPLGRQLPGIRSERLAHRRNCHNILPIGFGWRNLAATVAQVYTSLPPEEQAPGVHLWRQLWRGRRDQFLWQGVRLAHAISGHNQDYLWDRAIAPAR